MTSEERNSIQKQPGDICPFLDVMLERMWEAQKHIKLSAKYDSVEEHKRLLVDLECSLVDVGEIQLELAREEIIKLRAWGQAWKEKALGVDKTFR